VADHLRETYDSTREELGRHYRRTEGMMARNPTSSVLIGFGIGFGLGLVVTTMLGERHDETWSEKHLPDSLRRLPDSLQDTLERLGDTVRTLPDALKGHLASTLRR